MADPTLEDACALSKAMLVAGHLKYTFVHIASPVKLQVGPKPRAQSTPPNMCSVRCTWDDTCRALNCEATTNATVGEPAPASAGSGKSLRGEAFSWDSAASTVGVSSTVGTASTGLSCPSDDGCNDIEPLDIESFFQDASNQCIYPNTHGNTAHSRAVYGRPVSSSHALPTSRPCQYSFEQRTRDMSPNCCDAGDRLVAPLPDILSSAMAKRSEPSASTVTACSLIPEVESLLRTPPPPPPYPVLRQEHRDQGDRNVPFERHIAPSCWNDASGEDKPRLNTSWQKSCWEASRAQAQHRPGSQHLNAETAYWKASDGWSKNDVLASERRKGDSWRQEAGDGWNGNESWASERRKGGSWRKEAGDDWNGNDTWASERRKGNSWRKEAGNEWSEKWAGERVDSWRKRPAWGQQAFEEELFSRRLWPNDASCAATQRRSAKTKAWSW